MPGRTDRSGQPIELREFNTPEFYRTMVLTYRAEFVAKRVWQYLAATDPMAKTIVFCDDPQLRTEEYSIHLRDEIKRRLLARIDGVGECSL